MIVAYVHPDDQSTMDKVKQALGERHVQFRDPADFESHQADPLDHAVYLGHGPGTRAIRKAYEDMGVQVFDLEAETLEVAPESKRERDVRREREKTNPQAPQRQPLDAAAVPNVPSPDLTNPAASQRKRSQRSAADEATEQQAQASAEHSGTAGQLATPSGPLGGTAEQQTSGPTPAEVRPSARSTT